MKIRILSVVILLAIIIAVPVSAFSSRDIDAYSQRPMALAWWEGSDVIVALVNEDSSRQLYTVEIYDTQRRKTLAKSDLIVPSRSILIERITPEVTGNARFPIEEVTIYSGYRGRTIKIQDHEWFSLETHIVSANSNISVGLNLSGIRGSAQRGIIEVDREYSLANNNRTGQISVDYNPGFSYSHRNVIEYREPYLTLTMRAPNIRDVDILSFGLENLPSNAWRGDYIYGPVFLVYGNNYQIIDNTSSRSPSDSSPGWITR